MGKEGLLFHYSEDLSLYAHIYHEGKDDKSYEFLGAHFIDKNGRDDVVRFAVWAPNAKFVNLIGDFNEWHEFNLPMKRIAGSGIWEITVQGVKVFDAYKYRIVTQNDEIRYKADPYAFHAEERPKSASKVYDIRNYEWNDLKWKNRMKKIDLYNSPISIYEVNLSSWKKHPNNANYSYLELADDLVKYVKSMDYTHVEFMPITEYPYDGSWGYQALGYFAPTSRFGTPKDFMYLIDQLHQNGIGVIIDWVPVHFCKDDHGLARFDGTNCYESVNEEKANNVAWGTLNFDYSKKEVVNFLISSALFWHDYYHIDGIRVDAVAYMLYTDFSNPNLKNEDGTNINRDSVEFIKKLNTKVYEYFPNTMMIAEESTAYPHITMPIDKGGLGFSFKWNMGWMNDIIKYMNMDPIFRKDHHNALTFTMTYAFSENYILPFSHDEVVHAKGSMLNKMFGDYNNRFKQLRLLYTYMFTHPGRKLLFMGNEFAQYDEWDEWSELSWELLDFESHAKMQAFVKDLNILYKKEKALHEVENSFDGFNWIEHENAKESIIAYERIDKKGNKVICIFNFTPVDRPAYPIGVDKSGNYSIIINSDHNRYGGDTKRNKYFRSIDEPIHGKDYRINVDIPAYGGFIIKRKIK